MLGVKSDGVAQAKRLFRRGSVVASINLGLI
jgi:hypothetical protein